MLAIGSKILVVSHNKGTFSSHTELTVDVDDQLALLRDCPLGEDSGA